MPKELELLEIANAEHDKVSVPLKKSGNYIWTGTSWERWTGNNDGKPTTTYTWVAGELTQKVAVFADRTETTDYIWTDGYLTSKETTIS